MATTEGQTQSGSEAGASAARLIVCPYCGHAASHEKACERCRGLFEPLSRQASQNAMGPWFIRDEENPFRPGCNYQTLRTLTLRQRVHRETVLRGPSTRQFWMAATSVPGVAHLLGACHACKKPAGADDRACGFCGASFDVESDRQFLGLAQVRTLPGQPGPVGAKPTARPAPAAVMEVENRVEVEDLSSEGREESERERTAYDRPLQGNETWVDRHAIDRGKSRGRGVMLLVIVAAALAIGLIVLVLVVLVLDRTAASGGGGGAGGATGAPAVAPAGAAGTPGR